MPRRIEEERKIQPSRLVTQRGLFDGGLAAPVVRLSTVGGLGFLEWLTHSTYAEVSGGLLLATHALRHVSVKPPRPTKIILPGAAP